jgi:pimeloyl-ACP methyl ester carboxylesterase
LDLAADLDAAVVVATPPNIRYVTLPLLANVYGIPGIGAVMWKITTTKMVSSTMTKLFAPGFGEVLADFPADFLRMTRNSYVSSKAAVESYLRKQDFTERIAKSTTPFLVVFGAADQWVDPAATKQWASESRAQIQLIKGVGHTPPIECPTELAHSIRQWVDHTPD